MLRTEGRTFRASKLLVSGFFLDCRLGATAIAIIPQRRSYVLKVSWVFPRFRVLAMRLESL